MKPGLNMPRLQWMTGMMDTVLNLGLNDTTVEALAKKSGDRRFAFDSYRRFVQIYSDVVLGIEINHFEKHLERAKEKRGVKQETGLEGSEHSCSFVFFMVLSLCLEISLFVVFVCTLGLFLC